MNSKYITFSLTILLVFLFIGSAKAQLGMQNEGVKMLPDQMWNDLIQNGNTIGSVNAPVTLVEFSDFECPHCASFEKVLVKYRKEHPHQLRVVMHNFPLPQHRWAKEAALQSEGVAKYGNYEKYVELLFENQDKFSRQPWDSLATLAGVKNLEALHAYVKKSSVDKRIQKDLGLGMMIGLRQTPTIIINKMYYSGELSYEELTQAVKTALKERNN
jgi:protein-disulfide isomerase